MGQVITFLAAALFVFAPFNPQEKYKWLGKDEKIQEKDTVSGRHKPPKDFERAATEKNSFEEWLRAIPLRPDGAKVKLFNGKEKEDQDSHASVLSIDTGTRDLQQCADSAIRLRAEFLYSAKENGKIAFKFTNGEPAKYTEWKKGFRPEFQGNKTKWVKKANEDNSYNSFRKYLDIVFAYAGTASLCKEMQSIAISDMKAGDIFIEGGSPGHAVIIMDVILNKKNGSKKIMLAQGFMPAQDIHILKNPKDGTVWYDQNFGVELLTPHWKFKPKHLMRFK